MSFSSCGRQRGLSGQDDVGRETSATEKGTRGMVGGGP